jgi:hypothetical protein
VFKSLIVVGSLLAALAQGSQPQLVIPLKIEAVPARSFGRGAPVVLRATLGKANVPPAGGICSDPAFVIRIYDASLVATDPPRITPDQTHTPAKPVTPYLQETGVALDPLSGPDALRVQKDFPPFTLPRQKKGRFVPPRIYTALFRTCSIAKPVDIDQTQGTVIYNDTLAGTYMGGAFFKADCATVPGQCWYRPE